MAAVNLKKTDWTRLAIIALKAGETPLVWGPPGCGKSDMMREVVHHAVWGGDKDAPFICVVPSISDPTDATGLMAVIGDKAVRLTPEVMQPLFDAGKGTFMVDELTTGTQATQAAYMRVVQEGVIGDKKLPPAVRKCMAANPADIAAGGADLVVPLANRVIHIKASAPAPRDWANWLCSKLIDSAETRKTASMFAAFITANGDRLFNLPEDESKRAGAWPSPRTWHKAANCYSEALKHNDPNSGLDLVAGAVGEACAVELATFLQNVDLPDPRELLDGRATWKPERHRADRANAVLRAVASEAVNGPANDKAARAALVEKAWEITKSACDNGLTDLAFGAAVPLNKWRITNSGSPRTLGKFESEVSPRFFEIFSATSAGGR